MNNEAFTRLREEKTLARYKMCDEKSKEYTNDHDGNRLFNFEFIAELLKDAPQDSITIWGTYFLKHVLAIVRYIRTRKDGMEGIDGRIDDAQNYLDLLRPLIMKFEDAREDKDDIPF